MAKNTLKPIDPDVQFDSLYEAGRLAILHSSTSFKEAGSAHVVRVEHTSAVFSWGNVKEIIIGGTLPAVSGAFCYRGF